MLALAAALRVAFPCTWLQALWEHPVPTVMFAILDFVLGLHLFNVNKIRTVEVKTKHFLPLPVMVTHPTYPLPLLPHSPFQCIHMHPAVQDYCTLTIQYLYHPANQTRFPPQLLQFPLFPLFVHLCMAPVWLLLATTPVV